MATVSAKPLITTIMPTYRRPALLRRAILSALGQTYPHVRVLILDNASGDETAAVVQEIARRDPRISYVCRDRNVGLVMNIIDGIRRVETPFFSVLSDDDVLAPDFYRSAMEGFGRYPDAMMSAQNAVRVDMRGVILCAPPSADSGVVRYFGKGEALEAIARGTAVMPWIGTVFRTQAVRDVGEPNPRSGPCVNDNVIYRAAARYPCVINSSVGVAITENLASVGYSMPAISGECVEWWASTVEDIESDPEVTPEIKRKARALIVPDFRRAALQQVVHGLGGIGNRDLAFAEQAAVGAAQCGHPVWSRGLRFLVWSYRRIAVARRLMNLVIGLRMSKSRASRTGDGTAQCAPFVAPCD